MVYYNFRFVSKVKTEMTAEYTYTGKSYYKKSDYHHFFNILTYVWTIRVKIRFKNLSSSADIPRIVESSMRFSRNQESTNTGNQDEWEKRILSKS